ncbi:thermonuclease family protein [Plastoroseomonas arctica]|uniref:Thermonuclease family protein n=1 Tax=Plastoroseomonas arctica TaxID=1509237 RepID=A0AAF1JX53_9PROT|nr:thermonuclease family protein [Plastoroseomonas arctica]
MFTVAALTSLLLGLGLPTNLFGSAPREQEWSAQFGDVRIVDGETLRLGERVLRLANLDAPERGQSCRDAGGARFDCGDAAAAALARLIAGRPVICRVSGRDSFGRGLGSCSAGGLDLNAGLVASGFAAADGASLRLVEQEARRAARGLWAGTTPAWTQR